MDICFFITFFPSAVSVKKKILWLAFPTPPKCPAGFLKSPSLSQILTPETIYNSHFRRHCVQTNWVSLLLAGAATLLAFTISGGSAGVGVDFWDARRNTANRICLQSHMKPAGGMANFSAIELCMPLIKNRIYLTLNFAWNSYVPQYIHTWNHKLI